MEVRTCVRLPDASPVITMSIASSSFAFASAVDMHGNGSHTSLPLPLSQALPTPLPLPVLLAAPSCVLALLCVGGGVAALVEVLLATGDLHTSCKDARLGVTLATSCGDPPLNGWRCSNAVSTARLSKPSTAWSSLMSEKSARTATELGMLSAFLLGSDGTDDASCSMVELSPSSWELWPGWGGMASEVTCGWARFPRPGPAT